MEKPGEILEFGQSEKVRTLIRSIISGEEPEAKILLFLFGVNGKRFCTMMCVLCVELHMNDPPLSGLRILNGIPKKPQIQICYKSKFLCVKKEKKGDSASPAFDVFFFVLYALFLYIFSSPSGPVYTKRQLNSATTL